MLSLYAPRCLLDVSSVAKQISAGTFSELVNIIRQEAFVVTTERLSWGLSAKAVVDAVSEMLNTDPNSPFVLRCSNFTPDRGRSLLCGLCLTCVVQNRRRPVVWLWRRWRNATVRISFPNIYLWWIVSNSLFGGDCGPSPIFWGSLQLKNWDVGFEYLIVSASVSID